ncbi:hypothetical protein [Sediminibacterium ginsengisoli]|nr:hypothetical protein [Sediminibacterium ginsengisoli]
MKTQSVRAVVRMIILGVILSVAVTFGANAATPGNDSVDSVSSKQLNIRYAGVDADQLLSFNVKYNNPTGQKFSITVYDGNNEILYRESYSDKVFKKEFRLAKNDISKLTFLVQAGKQISKEEFDVNISTREIIDVVASRNEK